MPSGLASVPERWSVQITDLLTGHVLLARTPDRMLSTASLAKVFVLAELARATSVGTVALAEILDRRHVDDVGGCGVWRHMDTDHLTVADLAVLVGRVSDNLATNALIERLGLKAIQNVAARLAPRGSMIHDLVRDTRHASHPPAFSTGCASDWCQALAGIHDQFPAVFDWMADGAMDPASVTGTPMTMVNKTGMDAGVYCDAGLIFGPERAVTYAILCNWNSIERPSTALACSSAYRRLVEAYARGLGAPHTV